MKIGGILMATKYTKEQILIKYGELYEKLGRFPTQKDVNYESKMNSDFPGAKTIARHFGNLTNLKQEFGFKNIKWTREKLLNFLKNYYLEHGKMPSTSELDMCEDYPNKAYYDRIFNGIGNAINLLDIHISEEILNKYNNIDKLSNDELINLLIQFKNENNRYPTTKDFKSKNNMPSVNLIRNRFGSLQNAYDLAGFKFSEEYKRLYFSENKGITNDELLNKLREFYDKFGFPTTRKIKENKWMPMSNLYNLRFGSMKNALKLIGVEISEEKERFFDRDSKSDDEILSFFKNYIEENINDDMYLPTLHELNDIDDFVSSGVIISRFNSIENLYSKIGINKDEHNLRVLKNDMTKQYLNLVDHLGFVPNSREIDRYSQLGMCYATATYMNHFGSLINFQTKLGLVPTANIGYMKTPEQALDDLRKLADELGRLPIQRDANDNDWTPSATYYARHFGSFSKALKAAGLSNMEYNSRIKTTPQGNLCLSSYEYDFCCMLEDYNFKFEKEEFYKKYIPSLDRDFQIDFTLNFNDKIFIVEIFGMMEHEWYREKTEYKIQLCKNNGLNMIDLYKEDFYKKNRKDLYEMLIYKINLLELK
jgi:hypothetical protein